ncbi:MAG: bifunctional diaminohydroxyphosphoribosylaminopyrimidine deaminase/5-amino-6-(5-phosphoribosylamino)uracil reductase RibD [Planctomycetaceae bacterium]
MPDRFSSPADVMRHALALARRGQGRVEPNPMVGAVVVDGDLALLGEGWHQQFGGPHAEVHAIASAGNRCGQATLYCTLEPCSHQGQTPPCADAVIAAGFRKVVIAMRDPASHVNGRGIERLRSAGIEVEVGLLEAEARALAAPFVTLMLQGRPYVHAKWAMTLDGKIASRTGHSQWISNERSRARVHELRGRMDAILVGSNTALVDDPTLTARPPGERTATRIVLDSRGRLPSACRLTQTIREAPLLIVTTESSPTRWRAQLASQGGEVLVQPSDATAAEHSQVNLTWLLSQLGQRKWTNLLVEGGGEILGACFDADIVDECHVFIAPRIVGGEAAASPVRGRGQDRIPPAFGVSQIEQLGTDLYWRMSRPPAAL